ncbi:DNA processing protein DprA [Candidatus Thiodiazotropha endoloripes]|uniref:DNA-processing protein DprA n=1 Tax=Candidatus Thiodiazotropha endoloripes TaxID=1818881 RepID=UPI00083E1F65|nr:DNA-processing protein DprA [Candidatus Thiodiazotropha endoloripes]ODB85937.1 DNA processing protein DprA [Candidatus Thiodiazotropha endoloripes]
MQSPIGFKKSFYDSAVSPQREMAAYEALWCEPKASFKTIADRFRSSGDVFPSDLVSSETIESIQRNLETTLKRYNVGVFGIRVNGINEYPQKLRDARNPIEVFYFQGWWDLVNTPSVAIVGSRKVSEEGIKRTRKLVKYLVDDDFTIVSGLAEGVDTAAHTATIERGGRTIAVIGTPLSHTYPKQNSALQDLIKKEYLLISQVPFMRYIEQDYRQNRGFFPERNITMSALTQATIIVEASDTSGTLYQARAALAQGRKLFILESCFKNPKIEWPHKFAKKGAIRVADYDDIRGHLDVHKSYPNR